MHENFLSKFCQNFESRSQSITTLLPRGYLFSLQRNDITLSKLAFEVRGVTTEFNWKFSFPNVPDGLVNRTTDGSRLSMPKGKVSPTSSSSSDSVTQPNFFVCFASNRRISLQAMNIIIIKCLEQIGALFLRLTIANESTSFDSSMRRSIHRLMNIS